MISMNAGDCKSHAPLIKGKKIKVVTSSILARTAKHISKWEHNSRELEHESKRPSK